MMNRHGTPAAYERAVWKACNDGFITDQEAAVSVQNYIRQFYEAPVEKVCEKEG